MGMRLRCAMSNLSDFSNKMDDIEQRILAKLDTVDHAFKVYEMANEDLRRLQKERSDLMKKYQPQVVS
jgi:hypothetical protein